MIRIFVGYDNNEKVAFSTLSHSLLKHSTQPISITPIRLENIKDIFVRERLKIQSTEFAILVTPSLWIVICYRELILLNYGD